MSNSTMRNRRTDSELPANPRVDWKDALSNSWLIHDQATMDALLGLTGLTPSLHLNDFPTGHQIFVEGKPANRVYVIISGIVKITAALPRGRSTVRSLLGPGDIIDAPAVFDGSPHCCTATCQTLVRTASLSTVALQRLLTHRPQLAQHWLQALAQEVRHCEQDIALLASGDIAGRVARELIMLAEHLGSPIDGVLHVEHGLTRQEFAELTGAPKEPVGKALANFVAHGWIVTGPGRFEVTDIDQLRRRAAPAVAQYTPINNARALPENDAK
ncbi:MAG: Crp/Fnr family transcriptional regulator [Mycobacterium sp.]|nr:Crp/Fnr family transcriptional regulator [Mycobacterium sp.]